jgi:16S rRNA (guanine1207-N2)-methyltransferase
MLRDLRRRGRVGPVIAKAHGKLFVVEEADIADWIAEPKRNANGYLAPPGGFSADRVDPGSALLLSALPKLSGRVADLGAGWGALAAAILESDAVTRYDLVEAHLPSLDCARANIGDPRAAFHWADATGWRPDAPVDHVVTNPPFHRGRENDPGLGRAFFATAAEALGRRGTLWVVANRHLPYESTLGSLFADVEERPGTPAFKLHRAAHPRRRR